MPPVWQKIDAQWHHCQWWQRVDDRQTYAMDTNTAFETLATILALGGLAAPIAVLLERSHRRARRDHGVRTSWSSVSHDSDTRRIADEIHLLDGAAHR